MLDEPTLSHAALEAAQRGLAARQLGVALDHLLAAWRGCAAPPLAAVIDALDAEIARALPPLQGRTRAALHTRWLDLEAQRRPVDLSRLLPPLAAPPGGNVLRRIERLELWPRDPRIAARLVQLIIESPFRSVVGGLWTRIFGIAGRCADPRGRAALESYHAGETSDFMPLFLERHLSRVARLSALLPMAPVLDEAALAHVAALQQAVAALALAPPVSEEELSARAPGATAAAEPDDRALLALVLADPTSDAPRLVYGDWLQERGDPRGELIALQYKRRERGLSAQETRRERALLRRHGRQWLGAIEPVIDPLSTRFDRGFVSACRALFQTERQRAELLTHPLWATVEALEAEPALLAQPHLRALRRVDGLRPAGLAALQERGCTLNVQTVELRAAQTISREEEGLLARTPVLPALRHLRLAFEREDDSTPRPLPDALRWLFAGTLGRHLERFSLVMLSPRYGIHRGPHPEPAPWLPLLKGGALSRLDFVLFPFWVQTLRRAAGEEPAGVVYVVEVQCNLGNGWRGAAARLLAVPRALPAGALSLIVVRLRDEPKDRLERHLRRELAGLAPLELTSGGRA